MKYLVRTKTKDLQCDSEVQIRDWFLDGACQPGDFVFLFETKAWKTVADLAAIKNYFGYKPQDLAEKPIVYVATTGESVKQSGPFTYTQIKEKIAKHELCAYSWIFVEGDKEWRQVREVKVLLGLLPIPPQDIPEVKPAQPDIPSQPNLPQLEVTEFKTPAVPKLSIPDIELVEETKAVSLPKNNAEEPSFDGITAEIPQEPIWLIKKNNSEEVHGPFPYLQIRKMLDSGDISKDDKISKLGTNRYIKILQQYEFNVDYSLEKVVEAGAEKQKLYIRRRHPRVPYLADVQITKTDKTLMGVCLNISAGGVLIESNKTALNLGEVVTIKILPSAIPKTIICRALVTGKVPRTPPGYALRFMELKEQDKEAIEVFVQESMKKEKIGAKH